MKERAVRVRLTVPFSVMLPDVPVITIVDTPVGVFALDVKVNVVPVALALGLKLAFTPLGRPDAENDTTPLKPLNGTTMIWLCAMVPTSWNKLNGNEPSVYPWWFVKVVNGWSG
jgi:hypothetical protein